MNVQQLYLLEQQFERQIDVRISIHDNNNVDISDIDFIERYLKKTKLPTMSVETVLLVSERMLLVKMLDK